MSKGVGYYMLFAKTHDISNVKARALKKQMLKNANDKRKTTQEKFSIYFFEI